MTRHGQIGYGHMLIAAAISASCFAGATFADAPFGAEFDLARLLSDNGGDGSEGTVFQGPFFSRAGTSVSAIGDVSGDGLEDFAVGAPGTNNEGAAYVVFGVPGGFPPDVPLDSLASGDGTAGIRLTGTIINQPLGDTVRGVGDVDGDGVADFAISAVSRVWVVYGRDVATEGAFAPDIDLRTEVLFDLDPTLGFSVEGGVNLGRTSQGIIGPGDINGDGIDDFAVCDDQGDVGDVQNTGAAYVLYGRDGSDGPPFPVRVDVNDLLAGAGTGFVIAGAREDDRICESISSGDFNHDGVADLVIGAPRVALGPLISAGQSYVVYGRGAGAEPFPILFSVASLLPSRGGDGSQGFVVVGRAAGTNAGQSVAGTADINGDGIDDLLIGAPFNTTNTAAGEAYAVYGRDGAVDPFPALFGLGSLFPSAGGDGSRGTVFRGIDARDFTGEAVSSAGDINGDGSTDLLIGAPGADPAGRDRAGRAYLVYGATAARPFPAVRLLSLLQPSEGGDGQAGVVFVGVDGRSGAAVAGAGDVNDDGIPDLLIGSPLADLGFDVDGAAYLVLGRR